MMNLNTVQETIAFDIIAWFTFVTVMMIAALWTERESRSPIRPFTRPAKVFGEAEHWPALESLANTLELPGASTSGNLKNEMLSVIEGTLQRVNYPKKELWVVAQGHVWNFTLDPGCRLWFDNECAVLRCFHPLDNVKIVFSEGERKYVLKEMYAREKQPK
jgi:hypothetical protein